MRHILLYLALSASLAACDGDNSVRITTTSSSDDQGAGVLKVIDNIGDKAPRDPEQLEARIRGKVREIVRRTTRATPNVIPMITFLRPGEGKVMPPARSQAKKEGVDL